MPDYKSMYYKMFNSITDAIDILQKAQLEGENAYITSNDEPILFSHAKPPDGSDDNDQ